MIDLNFKKQPPAQIFSLWIDLIDDTSKGRYILQKEKNTYIKANDPKSKMTTLSILKVWEELLEKTGPYESFDKAQSLLNRFKCRCEKSFYKGFLGRLRKILSRFFKSFQYESSLVYKRIEELTDRMKIKKLKNKIFTKSINSPQMLHDMKTCLIEFFNCKKQEMRCKQSQGGYDFWNTREGEKKEAMNNLRSNPYFQLEWCWKEMEACYNENNIEVLKQMDGLFPENFKKRHKQLITCLADLSCFSFE